VAAARARRTISGVRRVVAAVRAPGTTPTGSGTCGSSPRHMANCSLTAAGRGADRRHDRQWEMGCTWLLA
jgi:hypothetical protein